LADQYDIDRPEHYAEAFGEREPTLSPNDSFILKIADLATEQLYKLLIPLVDKYRGKAEKFDAGTAFEPAVGNCLRSLVPSASVTSMAAVVNAAWEIRLELDAWEILQDMSDHQKRRIEKLRVLRDLVLKSFEVYEYKKRLAQYASQRG